MKLLLILTFAASVGFGQVPQFDPLLNDLTAPKSTGSSLTKASTPQAQAGVEDSTYMTPAKTADAIAALAVSAAGLKATVTSSTVLTVAVGSYKTGVDKRTTSADAVFTRVQPTLSGCTAVTFTVCTASVTLDLLTLRPGEFVNVLRSGVTGCALLTGLLEVKARTSTTVTLGADCSGGAPSGGTLTMGANPSAAGPVVVYGASNTTAVVLEHARSDGLYFTASASNATVRQVIEPSFDTDDEFGNFPIATVPILTTGNGTFDTNAANTIDERTAYSTTPIAEGLNMCNDKSGGVLTVNTCPNVVTEDGDHEYTGSSDFSAAAIFKVRSGSSLPATCPADTGWLFYKTSAIKGLYKCDTTNTPTAIGGSAKATYLFTAGRCNALAGNEVADWQPGDGGQAFNCPELPTGFYVPVIEMIDTKPIYHVFTVPPSWDGVSPITVRLHFVHTSSASPSGSWSIDVALAPDVSSTFATADTQTITVPAQNTGVGMATFTPTLPAGLAAGDFGRMKITFNQNGATGLGRFVVATMTISGI